MAKPTEVTIVFPSKRMASEYVSDAKQSLYYWERGTVFTLKKRGAFNLEMVRVAEND